MIWFVIWFALAVYSVAGLAVPDLARCRWLVSPRSEVLHVRGVRVGDIYANQRRERAVEARFRVGHDAFSDAGRPLFEVAMEAGPEPNQPGARHPGRGDALSSSAVRCLPRCSKSAQ